MNIRRQNLVASEWRTALKCLQHTRHASVWTQVQVMRTLAGFYFWGGQ